MVRITWLFLLASQVFSFSLPPPARSAFRKLSSPYSFASATADLEVVQEDTTASTAFRITDRTEEDSRFRYVDASVKKWRNTVPLGDEENLRLVREATLEKGRTGNPYWMSSALRTIFFATNALLANRIAGEASIAGNIDLTFRLYEVFLCYEQESELIAQGKIRFPWDFPVQKDRVQWDHRQANPLFVIKESINFISEATSILKRRNEAKTPGVSCDDDHNPLYPDYYLNDFHYQTDGWLSAYSAERYEMSSEAIFIGSQDVMQRQTILPMVSRPEPASILEVACGTGRFATFVRDQFPKADYTLSDLSPFYLEKAKENDSYWRGRRESNASPAKAVQTNAEELPFEDNSFDSVLFVYLFHELPVSARSRAAKEMIRVLKPGGQIVWSDSIQAGDRDAFQNLEVFGKFNEPHYVSYIYDDIPSYFEGMVCDEKHINSRTKTFSFIKPS